MSIASDVSGPRSSLPQLLETLAGEYRGIAMRVERADGITTEGIYEPSRTSPTALSLFITEAQAYDEIPLEDVERAWLPHVVKRRHYGYIASATIVAALVGVVSVRLTGSARLPGVLIGIATWLAIMVAEWLPFIRNWIVVWMLRYERPSR